MNISTANSKYFSSSLGFGEHKQTAINLMTKVINILNEFEIDYFLISGTLLGFVRHNDFIPWDDDMDLIVSDDILNKIKMIFIKYHKILIIKFINKYFIKISFREEGIPLNRCDCKFPFIDLFLYYVHPDPHHKKMEFFKRLWDYDFFYPPQEKTFLDITVKIPRIPHYFLKENYGSNYMTVYKSPSYSHKKEKHINTVVKHNIITNGELSKQ
jgi:phosphorylcholine metabolism protein LicD